MIQEHHLPRTQMLQTNLKPQIILTIIESQNILSWKEESHKNHRAQLLGELSKHFLNSNRLGAMATSLGSLYRFPTTLSVKNFFLISSLNLHTALKVRPHQCLAEWDNHFPYKLAKPLLMHPKIQLALLATKAHCWLVFSLLLIKTPRFLSSGLLSSILSPSLQQGCPFPGSEL